jgi:hypothetical protein
MTSNFVSLTFTVPPSIKDWTQPFLAAGEPHLNKLSFADISDPISDDEAPGSSLRALRTYPDADSFVIAQNADTVQVHASTGGIGPGFHAALVDWFLNLANHGFKIIKIEDETGYATHRDFKKLQAYFIEYATNILRASLPATPDQDFLMWLNETPHRQPRLTSGALIAPLGPISCALRDRALQQPALIPQFFRWWDRGENARAMRNLSLSLMWQTLSWKQPRCEDEERWNDLCLHFLNEAHKLDPTLDMPCAEWVELANLQPEPQSVPEAIKQYAHFEPKVRAGYRRNPCLCRPVPEVSFMAPGDLTYEPNNEDPEEGNQFWNEDLNIGTRVGYAESPFDAATMRENLTEYLAPASETDARNSEIFEIPGGIAAYTIRYVPSEDKGTICFVLAHLISPITYVRLDIMGNTPETEQIAIGIVRSASLHQPTED